MRAAARTNAFGGLSNDVGRRVAAEIHLDDDIVGQREEPICRMASASTAISLSGFVFGLVTVSPSSASFTATASLLTSRCNNVEIDHVTDGNPVRSVKPSDLEVVNSAIIGCRVADLNTIQEERRLLIAKRRRVLQQVLSR